MRRGILGATLVVALALPGAAQMRGGMARGGMAHFGGRAPVANHGAVRVSGFGGFGVGGFGGFGGGFGFGFGGGFGRPGFIRPRRPFCPFFNCFGGPFFRQPFFFGTPFIQPAVLPVPVYVGTPYYAEEYSPNPYPVQYQYQQPSPQMINDERGLEEQVARLGDEIEALKQQEQARQGPAKPQEPRPATVLVFKDKHQQEVGDYAIVGKTLWVLSQRRATKIPLSELDLDATERANEQRGLEFRVPR